nr:hypothetical protein [uncultured Ruegeria sp.]
MNKELANLVLEGLAERASVNRQATFLSEVELDALRVLLGKDAIAKELKKDNEIAEDSENLGEDEHFVVKWNPAQEIADEIHLCIDFGTSFSKAFACKGNDPLETPELIDIALSRDALGAEKYLMPSELLVHEGKVHFGRTARKLFEDLAAEQDRLIDNPKQYMTLTKEVANLSKRMLSDKKDPTGLFSERDVLVLYLSHLIRMVDLSLDEMGVSNSLLTRYTHPAWDKRVAAENAKAMERIVSEAMALARAYANAFESELDAHRAAALLLAARNASNENLPFALLEEPVLEATAAGAGALMDARPNGRQHYVILDIGAGTTDVGGCICVKRDEDHVSVWEIQSARGAKNLAGNMLDNALRKHILDQSSLAKGSSEYDQCDRALRKSIRAEKERLFDAGEISVDLVTDELVDVSLDQFLADPNVQKIFSAINEMVVRAAFAVSEGTGRAFLVPTGGGAQLPIVKDLTSKPLELDGKRLKLELAEAMPELLREAYPEIEPFYPQLAVSIGGAHPALPEQKESVDHFDRDPGKRTLAPVYRS